MSRTIAFCFAGRKENMELQLPYMQRILEENPDVEYHVWNLARRKSDAAWLRKLKGDRITVIEDFYGDDPWTRFNDVYVHYSDDQYADDVFVKLDDDVVFIETNRFGDFVDTIHAIPTHVISAKVVNNGACVSTDVLLQAAYNRVHSREPLALLDVHLRADFARSQHETFLQDWKTMTGQPLQYIYSSDWLSINLIGFDWNIMRQLARTNGSRSPRHVAGRIYNEPTRLGDEGSVNLIPRVILDGFMAAHLTFGPQEDELSADEITTLREGYAKVSADYLGGKK